MSMLYSKYEVNRKSTFKVIGNIKFHIQVGGLPDDGTDDDDDRTADDVAGQ